MLKTICISVCSAGGSSFLINGVILGKAPLVVAGAALFAAALVLVCVPATYRTWRDR